MADRKIKYVPVDELVPAERNPKRHDLPGLKASLRQFGVIEPQVVDDRTGRLVSGHGRADAFYELAAQGQDEGLEPPDGVKVRAGKWLVPISTGWASRDDAELEAAIVAVNRIGEGLWDSRVLADVLSDLAPVEGLLEVTGYDRPELDKLLADLAPPAPPDAFPEIDPDALPIDHRCPACGYQWSGNPAPGVDPTDEAEGAEDAMAASG